MNNKISIKVEYEPQYMEVQGTVTIKQDNGKIIAAYPLTTKLKRENKEWITTE